MVNPFTVPISFRSMKSSATASINGKDILLGLVNVSDLAAASLEFTVPAGQTAISKTLPALTDLPLPSVIAVLKAFNEAKNNLPITVVADATVALGDYSVPVSITTSALASIKK